ncbi:VCBS domain-containing protein [Methylobacterium sp. A54F]
MRTLDAHDALPTGGAFGLASVREVEAGAAPTVAVDDAGLLFRGHYARVGSDLILSDEGHRLVVRDYFSVEKRPALVAPNGASLPDAVVAGLSLAPGGIAVAQAGAGGASDASAAIGRVQKLTGSATVIRNGTAVTLHVGDLVYKSDMVQTEGASSLAVAFLDGTVFNLSANARMMLNDMVYQAEGGANASLFSLVQGTITFVAGKVAKTGDMKVGTPVATMGIRGTAVHVQIDANDGTTRFSVMTEPDGTTGRYDVFDRADPTKLLFTVSDPGLAHIVRPNGPSDVTFEQVAKTPFDIQVEQGFVQSIFRTQQEAPRLPVYQGPSTGGGGGSSTPPNLIQPQPGPQPGEGPAQQPGPQPGPQPPGLGPGNPLVTPPPTEPQPSHGAEPPRAGGQVPATGPATGPATNPNPTTNPATGPTTTQPTTGPTETTPTTGPTTNPTTNPTTGPTTQPNTQNPATEPTQNPTTNPTTGPTTQPTTEPSGNGGGGGGGGGGTTTGDLRLAPQTAAVAQGGVAAQTGDGSGVLAPGTTQTTEGARITGAQAAGHAEAPVTQGGTVLTGRYGDLTLRADGTYSYAANNAAPLAEGQQDTDVFTYRVAGRDGATAQGTLTVTVTGLNDRPEIEEASAGNASGRVHIDASVAQPDAAAAGDVRPAAAAVAQPEATSPGGGTSSDLLKQTVTVAFSDPDRGDTHAASASLKVDSVEWHTAAAEGTSGSAPARGTLPADVTATVTAALERALAQSALTEPAAGADGKAVLTFSLPAEDVAFLAKGESLTATYAVLVTDRAGGDGGTSRPLTVDVTITGTNDAPVITGARPAPVTIEAAPSNGRAPLDATAASYLTTGGGLVATGSGDAPFGALALEPGDDNSSAPIDITAVFGAQGLNFFGTAYRTLYINNNGNITFAGPSGTYTPTRIDAGQNNPIIAAFWADVDTRGGGQAETPGGHSTGANRVYVDADAAHGVLTVTWDDVGYYNTRTDHLNAFQLQLVSLGNGDFDIAYRYEAVNWTTGEVSGGAAARIGYASGTGTAVELPVSGDDAALRALPTTSGNTGIPGLYVYEVTNGTVTEAPALRSSGTFAFTDPDLSDRHGVTTALPAGAIQWQRANGTSAGTVDDATRAVLASAFAAAIDTESAGHGSVKWSFTLANASAAFLGAGERLTATYTATVTDAWGGASEAVPVAVTLVGVNDAPVITGNAAGDDLRLSAASAEATSAGAGSSGTVAFSDPDLHDTHTVSYSLVAAQVRGEGGSTAVTGQALDDLRTRLETAHSFTVGTVTESDGQGRATWTFHAPPAGDGAAPDAYDLTYAITVKDAGGLSATTTVTVAAQPNHAPVATDPTAVLDAAGNAAGTLAASDADGDPLTFARVADDATHHGTLEIDAATGRYTYLRDAGFAGSDAFTVSVTDGRGGATTAMISIPAVGPAANGHAPVAVDGDATVGAGATLYGRLAATDEDPGDHVAFDPVQNLDTTYGRVTIRDDGTYTYTNRSAPSASGDAHGFDDSFDFLVHDDAGHTDRGTVTIHVTPPSGTGPVAGEDSPGGGMSGHSSDGHSETGSETPAGAGTTSTGEQPTTSQSSTGQTPADAGTEASGPGGTATQASGEGSATNGTAPHAAAIPGHDGLDGHDTFVFAPTPVSTAEVPTIRGFSAATDVLSLDSFHFSAAVTAGELAAAVSVQENAAHGFDLVVRAEADQEPTVLAHLEGAIGLGDAVALAWAGHVAHVTATGHAA